MLRIFRNELQKDDRYVVPLEPKKCIKRMANSAADNTK